MKSRTRYFRNAPVRLLTNVAVQWLLSSTHEASLGPCILAELLGTFAFQRGPQ
jgi:hypothetical protein